MKNRAIILLSFIFLSSLMALSQKMLDEMVKESIENPSKNQRQYADLWTDGVLTANGINYERLARLTTRNNDEMAPAVLQAMADTLKDEEKFLAGLALINEAMSTYRSFQDAGILITLD